MAKKKQSEPEPARAASGRPPVYESPVSITITLEESEHQRLEDFAATNHGAPKSRIAAAFIVEGLDKNSVPYRKA